MPTGCAPVVIQIDETTGHDPVIQPANTEQTVDSTEVLQHCRALSDVEESATLCSIQEPSPSTIVTIQDPLPAEALDTAE